MSLSHKALGIYNATICILIKTRHVIKIWFRILSLGTDFQFSSILPFNMKSKLNNLAIILASSVLVSCSVERDKRKIRRLFVSY